MLAAAPIVTALGLAKELAAGSGAGVGALVFALTVVIALYGGLILPMRYRVSDTDVLVRHGLVTQRIPLADITEVYSTRNPLSSPALSLDRLYIKFGEGFFKAALISPADKAGFLAELVARGGLVAQGEKWVRAAKGT